MIKKLNLWRVTVKEFSGIYTISLIESLEIIQARTQPPGLWRMYMYVYVYTYILAYLVMRIYK